MVENDTLLTGQNDTDAGNVEAVVTDGVQADEKSVEGAVETTEQKQAEEKPFVPEKYEFVAPEGVQLDQEVLGEFEGVARELGLTQDKAQSVIDKMTPKIQARQMEAMQTHMAQVKADWEKAATTDKEYGGDAFKENIGLASRVLQTFGTPELSTYLKDSGLGNHPELIRLMVRVGKGISDDQLVNGKEPKSAANTGLVYSNSNMK